MDKPIIIEFVGLPGAGKSTVCHELRKALSEQGFHVWTRHDYWSFWDEGKGLVRNPLIYFAFMKTLMMNLPLILESTISWQKLLSVFPLRYRLFVLKNFLITLHENEVVRRLQHTGVALVDEGVIQRAYTIFFHLDRVTDSQKLARYISKIRPPDILVYLKISNLSALERLQERALPARMLRMSPERKAIMLKTGEEFLEQLVDLTKSGSKCTVVEFDAEDIADATTKLRGFLEERLGRSGCCIG